VLSDSPPVFNHALDAGDESTRLRVYYRCAVELFHQIKSGLAEVPEGLHGLEAERLATLMYLDALMSHLVEEIVRYREAQSGPR
jgi:hypothetical protein